MRFQNLGLPFLILFIGIFLPGCKEKHPYQTIGNVEANLFYVASPMGGYLKELPIQEGQTVTKDQTLLKLKNQNSLKAPADSKVIDIMYQVEEYVPPTSPIVSLLIPNRMKIIFYVPEKNLNKVFLGKRINFLLNNKKYFTKISYIANQAEFTPEAIFSEKNRYKLVYKIKTFVTPELQGLLKPGQPIDLDYE